MSTITESANLQLEIEEALFNRLLRECAGRLQESVNPLAAFLEIHWGLENTRGPNEASTNVGAPLGPQCDAFGDIAVRFLADFMNLYGLEISVSHLSEE